MLDGRPVSDKHIRPYVLCRTPEILLMSEEEIFALIPPVEEAEEMDDAALDMDEELNEEENEHEEGSDEILMLPGTARITCYSLLQDTACALPKSDDQKLAELRSTQTGQQAWDETTILLMHLTLQNDFGVNASEAELAQCVTIGDLVGLIKSKSQS